MRSRNHVVTLAVTFFVLTSLNAAVTAQEILPDGTKTAELAIAGVCLTTNWLSV
ncbi:MAG: hypothetical protein ACKVHE_12995 [Planctomycetales bacterium]|jgi:hypothetical protein